MPDVNYAKHSLDKQYCYTYLNKKTGSNFDFNPLLTETGLFRRHDFQNELQSKKVQVKKLSYPLPNKPYEVDYSDQLTTKEVIISTGLITVSELHFFQKPVLIIEIFGTFINKTSTYNRNF